MGKSPLDRLRTICLALPEAAEAVGHSRPVFQVRGKTFVMFMDNHHSDGRVAIWCKAPPGGQEVLAGGDPARFFVPPYVGHRGWVGVRLEGPVDWHLVADLIADSYRMTAPKRLLAELEGREEQRPGLIRELRSRATESGTPRC